MANRKSDSKRREDLAFENLVNPALKPDRKAQREFLLQALQERQDKFLELLDKAAKDDPVLYLRMYMELSKLVVPKNSDVNVNLSLNRDFIELKALGQSGVRGGIGGVSVPGLPSGVGGIVGGMPVSGLSKEEAAEFEEIGVAPFESLEGGIGKVETTDVSD